MKSRNYWREFKDDCPVIARIPIIGTLAFGVWARAYFETKERLSK